MDDTITVRAARLHDLTAAAKLAAALVREHHAYDPLRFMCIEPLEDGYERFLRTQVDREGVVLLVAAAGPGPDETIVGYVLGSLEDRDWSDLRDACGKSTTSTCTRASAGAAWPRGWLRRP